MHVKSRSSEKAQHRRDSVETSSSVASFFSSAPSTYLALPSPSIASTVETSRGAGEMISFKEVNAFDYAVGTGKAVAEGDKVAVYFQGIIAESQEFYIKYTSESHSSPVRGLLACRRSTNTRV